MEYTAAYGVRNGIVDKKKVLIAPLDTSRKKKIRTRQQRLVVMIKETQQHNHYFSVFEAPRRVVSFVSKRKRNERKKKISFFFLVTIRPNTFITPHFFFLSPRYSASFSNAIFSENLKVICISCSDVNGIIFLVTSLLVKV